MANEFFTILTATGRSKLAHATANGAPLTLTHMAVGSGNNGAYYNPSEAQTTLKKEVWRGPLNHLDVAQDNPNWIVAELTIPDNVGGFYIREVGLFDKAGDMIAVGRFPESYKPNVADGSNKQLYVRMILEVANTSAITLLVDTNIAIANRQYVDSKLAEAMQTLDHKQSARAATTGHITLSGLQSVDGVSLVAGNRVLVKNQNFAGDNGIYVVAIGTWVRAVDADTSAKVTPGLSLPVEEGSVNSDSVWQLVTDAPVTLGTTALIFEMAAGKTGVIAGTYDDITVNARGLVLSGTNTTTPPQFDNSTQKATTEFVQRALGNYRSGTQITVSKSLTSADAGKIYQVAANGVTVTLPSPANAHKTGLVFTIFSNSFDWTLTTASGSVFNGRYPVSSMLVKMGTSVTVSTTDGAWWFVHGTGTLPTLGIFASSMSSNGYQKLPSGLIIQWGNGLFSGNTPISFPIIFPTECLQVLISPGNYDQAQPAYQKVVAMAAYSPTASGFLAASSTTAMTAGKWLAIGC